LDQLITAKAAVEGTHASTMVTTPAIKAKTFVVVLSKYVYYSIRS
jgi:hypothetical protein